MVFSKAFSVIVTFIFVFLVCLLPDVTHAQSKPKVDYAEYVKLIRGVLVALPELEGLWKEVREKKLENRVFVTDEVLLWAILFVERNLSIGKSPSQILTEASTAKYLDHYFSVDLSLDYRFTKGVVASKEAKQVLKLTYFVTEDETKALKVGKGHLDEISLRAYYNIEVSKGLDPAGNYFTELHSNNYPYPEILKVYLGLNKIYNEGMLRKLYDGYISLSSAGEQGQIKNEEEFWATFSSSLVAIRLTLNIPRAVIDKKTQQLIGRLGPYYEANASKISYFNKPPLHDGRIIYSQNRVLYPVGTLNSLYFSMVPDFSQDPFRDDLDFLFDLLEQFNLLNVVVLGGVVMDVYYSSDYHVPYHRLLFPLFRLDDKRLSRLSGVQMGRFISKIETHLRVHETGEFEDSQATMVVEVPGQPPDFSKNPLIKTILRWIQERRSPEDFVDFYNLVSRSEFILNIGRAVLNKQSYGPKNFDIYFAHFYMSSQLLDHFIRLTPKFEQVARFHSKGESVEASAYVIERVISNSRPIAENLGLIALLSETNARAHWTKEEILRLRNNILISDKVIDIISNQIQTPEELVSAIAICPTNRCFENIFVRSQNVRTRAQDILTFSQHVFTSAQLKLGVNRSSLGIKLRDRFVELNPTPEQQKAFREMFQLSESIWATSASN